MANVKHLKLTKDVRLVAESFQRLRLNFQVHLGKCRKVDGAKRVDLSKSEGPTPELLQELDNAYELVEQAVLGKQDIKAGIEVS